MLYPADYIPFRDLSESDQDKAREWANEVGYYAKDLHFEMKDGEVVSAGFDHPKWMKHNVKSKVCLK